MSKPHAPTSVKCPLCEKTLSRKGDLPRHLKTHLPNKDKISFYCPHEGCRYKTLQRSNLNTHLNVHTGERPHKCPAEGCDFDCGDPGVLTRHREDIHGYIPQKNSRRKQTASTRKEVRRQRRVAPYPTSSPTSPSGSARSSPITPRPQLTQLDLYLPSSLLPTTDVEDGVKNTSAAFHSDLITRLPQVNDPQAAPSPERETSLLLPSGSTTAPEAHAVGHFEFPVLEQGDVAAVELTAQPVSGIDNEFSDAILDNFLAQLEGRCPEAAPAYTPPSLPVPLVSYMVNNAPLPTPASLPVPGAQYAVSIPAPASFFTPSVQSNSTLTPNHQSLSTYGVTYIVDTASVPAPEFLPAYELSYTVDNAGYTPYGYSTETASSDGQFPQPYLFATPDMGAYPQVEDAYYYPAAGPSVSSTQGFYAY